MRITKAQAEGYLLAALDKFAAKIDPLIKRPINENERGAFLSLAYNIGPSAFSGSSALKYFNEGNKAEAASRIQLWNKGTVNGRKVVLNGLVRRRAAERALFLTPTFVRPDAPSATPSAPAASTGLVAAIIAAVVAFFALKKG
jgi:lysozyme